MSLPEEKKLGRRGIWRRRRQRFASGVNVFISVLLAAVAVGMVNYLAQRYHTRWDIGSTGYYRLSDKTRGLLSSLDSTVTVLVFFQKSHGLFDDVRKLLKEYEYEADKVDSLDLVIKFVDPDRDLSEVRELTSRFDVHDPNVIVFDCQNRRKYVEARDIINYDYVLTGTQRERRMTGFAGEQLFSSAIQNVTQAARPNVFFLTGHGERDINDYSPNAGYSSVARTMRRDNMAVAPLMLTAEPGIPDDCSAIVVAGPDRRLSDAEIERLSDYLDKNGRILFLLDPANPTGLEGLLAKWGVDLAPGVVRGLTLTGRELYVAEYGEHPITANLEGVTTMFYMPRPVEAAAESEAGHSAVPDKPRVVTLASCTREGWLETDLRQNPPRYDARVDRRGPVGVAVAVEKGSVAGIDVEIKPTRVVVIGDSDFVSNGALSSGVGGNVDLVMSALNWLVERESLMAISPKAPGFLHLGMHRRQLRSAFLLIAFGVPALIALIGALVWWRRRR